MIYSLTISLICFLAFALIAFCDFTLPNRLLRNTHFQSFSVKDWLQCVEACHAEPSCVSYNYDASNLKMCQLNNCAFRDRCEAFRNLLVSPNAIFHQLRPVSSLFKLFVHLDLKRKNTKHIVAFQSNSCFERNHHMLR